MTKALIPHGYVLTGGPCCGKTTLLTELGKLGFATVQEAARKVLDDNLMNGISIDETRKDGLAFQLMVVKTALELEEAAPKDRVVFLDRSLADGIAYSKLFGIQVPDLELMALNRYRKVFFLEQLPYKKDYARMESEEMVKRINELLLEAYTGLGYDIVKIPVASVEERMKMILEHVSEPVMT